MAGKKSLHIISLVISEAHTHTHQRFFKRKIVNRISM